MKAILIDTKNQTVSEVEVPDGNDSPQRLEAIYKWMDCQTIESAIRFEEGDALYVDENGLYDNENLAFQLRGLTIPLLGNALILGVDDEGESVDYKSSLDFIKGICQFFTATETAAFRSEHANASFSFVTIK